MSRGPCLRPVAALTLPPAISPDGEGLGLGSERPCRLGSELVSTKAPIRLAARLTFTPLGRFAGALVQAHAGRLAWAQSLGARPNVGDGETGLASPLAVGEDAANLARSAAPKMTVPSLHVTAFKKLGPPAGHAGEEASVAEAARRLARASGGGTLLARMGAAKAARARDVASSAKARHADRQAAAVSARSEPPMQVTVGEPPASTATGERRLRPPAARRGRGRAPRRR